MAAILRIFSGLHLGAEIERVAVEEDDDYDY